MKLKLNPVNIVSAVIVTVIAAVVVVLTMTLGRQETLTGYNIEFALRDEGSTFEIASLTKAQTEKVDAQIENHSISNSGVFVFQDSKGTQYVSQIKLFEHSSWESQSFEGPISWGKYTIVEVSYVDVTLSSANPLKVIIDYSTHDRFLGVWVWLFWVVVFWLGGISLSIFE